MRLTSETKSREHQAKAKAMASVCMCVYLWRVHNVSQHHNVMYVQCTISYEEWRASERAHQNPFSCDRVNGLNHNSLNSQFRLSVGILAMHKHVQGLFLRDRVHNLVQNFRKHLVYFIFIYFSPYKQLITYQISKKDSPL